MLVWVCVYVRVCVHAYRCLYVCVHACLSVHELVCFFNVTLTSFSSFCLFSLFSSFFSQGRYRSVVPFVSDVRAFLNSFKTKSTGSKVKSSLSTAAAAAAAAAALDEKEASPLKRRRFPVLPVQLTPPVQQGKKNGKLEKVDVDDPEISKANVEALLEFFNERLVVRLAIL